MALLLVFLLAAMSLTACSSSSSTAATIGEEEKAANSTISEKDGKIGGALEDGTYKLVNIYLDGEDLTKTFTSIQKVGLAMNLVVNGTDIQIIKNTYTLKDGKFVGAEETIPYAVNGNKVIVLDTDGSKMIFEKE